MVVRMFELGPLLTIGKYMYILGELGFGHLLHRRARVIFVFVLSGTVTSL